VDVSWTLETAENFWLYRLLVALIITILMFLTSFNTYFVFDYACFMWICPKTGIWLYLPFLGQGLDFLVKTGWQPCCWSLGLKFRDWLLHWLKLTNLFSKVHSVYLIILFRYNYPLYTALLSCSRWIGNPLSHSSTTVSVSPSCLSAHGFNHMRFSESN